MVEAVSSRLLGVAVALCLTGGCSGASSKSGGPSSTQVFATTSSFTTSTQPSTTSTTSAIAVPGGLPRFVVASVDAPPAIDGRTLIALDRRTGRQIPLVSPANPPPLLSDDPWSLSGFDVSPDGRWVAFGVVSENPSRSSTAPPTTAAAIYLEPIDGSSAAKRTVVISGASSAVAVERFSPDGRWLLGAAERWTVWPVGGGAPIVSDVYSPYADAGVQWSPDGTQIAYGEHHERNSPLLTSMLRFDAPHRTLTRTAVSKDSATLLGADPWFSADGVLHVITDPTAMSGGAADVDSSFRYGLSVSPTWWNTATGPQDAQPLPGPYPKGFVTHVAW